MMNYGYLLIPSTVLVPLICIWLFYPATVSHYNLKDASYGIYSIESNIQENPADIDISIIFPAYNEEARITSTLESTASHIQHNNPFNLSYEIIVVDDGSSDDTIPISKAFMAKYDTIPMQIVKLSRNHGKGGAVKIGSTVARGKYTLMADADGATDINDLTKLYFQLQVVQSKEKGISHGMAVGSRAHLEKESISKRAFYRTILMHGFHILVSMFCTEKIRDTQCGFKLFTAATARKLFDNLHLERWAFDIELIYVAETLKIPMVEVAVNWQEIPGSKLIRTKLDVITTSLEMARDIICIRLSYLLGIWKIK